MPAITGVHDENWSRAAGAPLKPQAYFFFYSYTKVIGRSVLLFEIQDTYQQCLFWNNIKKCCKLHLQNISKFCSAGFSSKTSTSRKMSEYGVFSGPYFPVFWLNGEISRVNLRIQSKYEKIRTRKSSVFGHSLRSDDLRTYCENMEL